MPWATNDDVTCYYERDGAASDDAETVVLLQGLGYGRWMWRWVREALRDDFDVIAPDTRGTGRSASGIPRALGRLPRRLRSPLLARVGFDVGDLAADLEAVLAEAGVRDAHLVGTDLGGMIAQRYALEYDRAATLTLCGTSHGGTDAAPIPDDALERLRGGDGATERARLRNGLRPAFSERFTNRNPHLMDRIVEWRFDGDATGLALEAQLAATRAFDASDRLEYLRVPTLVCHGTDDRVVPVENARLLHERLPESRLELVGGGSHLFVVEEPDALAARLRTFVERPAVH